MEVGIPLYPLIVVPVALAAYLFIMSPLNTLFEERDGGIDYDSRTPTVTFVPKDTPGAITWEEYQRQRYPHFQSSQK